VVASVAAAAWVVAVARPWQPFVAEPVHPRPAQSTIFRASFRYKTRTTVAAGER
jgi:hypothetical protein